VNKTVKREMRGKREVRKFLADVPQECSFRCHDGNVLKSMKELCDAFSAMGNETYGYHCNAEKNDFSNWVREVIGDVQLAKDLERATSRSLAAWEVAIRMVYLANTSRGLAALKNEDQVQIKEVENTEQKVKSQVKPEADSPKRAAAKRVLSELKYFARLGYHRYSKMQEGVKR
jgi:hypothetical protein